MPTQVDKGKCKAVTFGENYITASESGLNTSEVHEGNASAVEYRKIHRGSPPFYESSYKNEPTSSGASGKNEGGEAANDARKDSSST